MNCRTFTNCQSAKLCWVAHARTGMVRHGYNGRRREFKRQFSPIGTPPAFEVPSLSHGFLLYIQWKATPIAAWGNLCKVVEFAVTEIHQGRVGIYEAISNYVPKYSERRLIIFRPVAVSRLREGSLQIVPVSYANQAFPNLGATVIDHIYQETIYPVAAFLKTLNQGA